MALGAGAPQVQIEIIGRTLRLTLLGIALGTLASLALSKVIASLLFGTQPTDAATFGAVIVLLSSVALIAACVPAHRASRIDPVVALRAD
jgi:ABC-type antimicrobial peptide transport system permease subunit